MHVCMWCVCYTSCLSACTWSTRSMSLLSTLGSRSHTDVYITAFSLCSMSDMASLQLLVIYQVIKLSFTSLDSDIKQWSFRPCNFWRDLLVLTFEKKSFMSYWFQMWKMFETESAVLRTAVCIVHECTMRFPLVILRSPVAAVSVQSLCQYVFIHSNLSYLACMYICMHT